MKHLFTLLSLLIGTLAFSQVIQNRGFEDWTVDSTQCPTGYECTNDQTFGQSIEPVIKTSLAHSGRYALSLETHIVAKDTFFGYIIKGDIDNQSGGIAYADRPDSLTGYAHYDVKPGDTALILAVFRRSGVPIGSCFGEFVGTEANFTRFSFPIDWQTPAGIMPDSMIFAAASSNALNEIGIANGSKLVLDNVSFIGTGTIAQPLNNGFENWNTIKSEAPNEWSSFLDYPFAYKYNLVNKLLDRSKINSGNSAIEIKTDIIDGDTLLGYLNNYGDDNPGGYAFTKQIDTLTGYYHFQSPGIDSGTAMITLHSGMQEFHKGVRLPPNTSYTEFNLPFNCPFKPDSIRIAFIAGTEFNHTSIVKGSALWLDDLDFKVCDIPVRPSGFVGETEVCNTVGVLNYSIQQQNDANNYSWKLPVGFSITSAPIDSNHVEVTVDSASAGSGVLEVTANVYCGASPAEMHQIDVDTTPSKPVITGHSALNAGSVGDKYLWFIDGTLSLIDTSKILDPPSAEEVNYSVVVVNGDCASDTSESHYHSPGSINGNSITLAVHIYPNPTSSALNLKIANGIEQYDVQLFSSAGQLVLESSNNDQLDLSGLPSGVYSLQVVSGNEQYTHRIIKQ